MIIKDINSKEAKERISRFRESDKFDLFDAYKQPSAAKFRAYQELVKFCMSNFGTTHKICSYNCHSFTFAFWGRYIGATAFYYITKEHIYCYIDKGGETK